MKLQDKKDMLKRKRKDIREDMQLAKKRVNTLHYVFDAMMHDASKMRTATGGKLPVTIEFEKLKSRSSNLLNDLYIASEEYRRLLKVYYVPEICPVLEGVE